MYVYMHVVHVHMLLPQEKRCTTESTVLKAEEK